jgi:hypothetical protein
MTNLFRAGIFTSVISAVLLVGLHGIQIDCEDPCDKTGPFFYHKLFTISNNLSSIFYFENDQNQSITQSTAVHELIYFV